MTEDVASAGDAWPSVVSATELSNSFLGGLLEICFVTTDHQRTMEGIFQDHLDRHGEGIHHVAFDVGQRPWDERLSAFVKRGFPVSQSGRFMDQNALAFFDTELATGATFETYDIPAGFVWPEPEGWFPGPPPAGSEPPVRDQRG